MRRRYRANPKPKSLAKGMQFIGFVHTKDLQGVKALLTRHGIHFHTTPDKFHTDGSEKDWHETYVEKKAKRNAIAILKVHFAASRKKPERRYDRKGKEY